MKRRRANLVSRTMDIEAGRRRAEEVMAGDQKPRKVSVTLRIDEDVVAFFREKGPGYQTRINNVLRRFYTNVSRLK